MARVSPLITGFVVGIWIAIGQAVFRIFPPNVYTVCMIGQPNDLFSSVANYALGTNFFIHPVSRVFPLLTPIGILVGGFIGALLHKEFKLRLRERARDPIGMGVIGFLAANFGSMLAHCPIMVTATVAYGSLEMLVGLLFIAVGAVLAVEYTKWRARR